MSQKISSFLDFKLWGKHSPSAVLAFPDNLEVEEELLQVPIVEALDAFEGEVEHALEVIPVGAVFAVVEAVEVVLRVAVFHSEGDLHVLALQEEDAAQVVEHAENRQV